MDIDDFEMTIWLSTFLLTLKYNLLYSLLGSTRVFFLIRTKKGVIYSGVNLKRGEICQIWQENQW